MNEKLLIAACKRGESWACKKIYETYAPVMMSVCMRYVNDRDTAQDLLQEGFIKVYTKIRSYSGEGAFGGWVRRVFVTTALEYLRSTNAMKLNVSMEESGTEPSYWDESALERITAEELMRCMEGLPDGYRTVFNLYAIEGYSHKEIAGILNISEITSRTQFIRGRNALQKSVLALMEKDDVGRNRT
ncbi:MAG: sigma-70 family RNA polymerase sigma factor [Tannerellaceae bacterium]|jgi:RNA polymerase sigma-70 factor (ECF subfamily)|nr:sigma-70 family RNA polymerase sigma factor [Tannerellaceae bacterium]